MRLQQYIKGYLIVLLFSICNSANAQFILNKGGKAEVLQFKLIKNLIIVPLVINEKGPYNFVLDTGVGIFLITDPGLADSLELEHLRNIKITGFGEGKDLNANVSSYLNVRISSSIEGYLPAAILEKDAFDLSSYTGMPVHGLLGYEFFNSFIVRINYELKTIKIYKPETWYIPRKGHPLTISIEAGKPYVQSTIAISDKRLLKAKLVIDTGAGHPVWLENYNEMPIEVPENSINANLGVGLSGNIDGKIARLKYIRLGKFELEQVIAAFPDFDDAGSKFVSNRTGNIGNAILKRFHVVFDYGRKNLFLKPNTFFKQAFEHDMSGLELAYEAPDFNRVFVARVEPNSAATECGIKVNDEILAVNFKPVKEMNIDEIYQLFHSRDGRNIALTIRSRGEKTSEIKILTLTRRI